MWMAPIGAHVQGYQNSWRWLRRSAHLECELASVAENNGLDGGVLLLVAGLDLLQHTENEDRSLAHA